MAKEEKNIKTFEAPKEIGTMLEELKEVYKQRETPLSVSEIIRLAIKNFHRKEILNKVRVKA